MTFLASPQSLNRVSSWQTIILPSFVILTSVSKNWAPDLSAWSKAYRVFSGASWLPPLWAISVLRAPNLLGGMINFVLYWCKRDGNCISNLFIMRNQSKPWMIAPLCTKNQLIANTVVKAVNDLLENILII